MEVLAKNQFTLHKKIYCLKNSKYALDNQVTEEVHGDKKIIITNGTL